MSASVLIEQTDGGWDVTVKEGESVLVRTDGNKVYVSVAPDDDGTKPLAVQLA